MKPTPPRSLTRTKNKPWCVLDLSSTTPAVMRCKNCHTEVPVHFPMDLGQHKSQLETFMNNHALCGLGLKKLYAKRKKLREQMEVYDADDTLPFHRMRKRLQAVEATIEHMKKPTNPIHP